MYSYMQNLLPTYFNKWFKLNSQIHYYNTRNSKKMRLPSCRMNTQKFSVLYYKTWFNTNAHIIYKYSIIKCIYLCVLYFEEDKYFHKPRHIYSLVVAYNTTTSQSQDSL